MNRRQFLTGSLTLVGLGALGCQRAGRRHRPLPQGERKDPSFQQGHRLRTAELPERPARVETYRGVILGGGVSGLSAAWRWDHAGLDDFCLLELEPSLGGNSRCLEYPATRAPIAAHYLPLPNLEARAVRRLLSEMGVLRRTERGTLDVDSRHLCHSPQERLFFRGEWYQGLLPPELFDEETEQQVESFHRHIRDWSARRDQAGRKAFALPMAYSSPDPEFTALDRISFGEYAAAQGWSSPLLRWYLQYACRDDFGGTLENCSAWAGLHYFAARDGGGLGDSSEILVWPEGNFRLVEHLASRAAARCRSGSLVVSVVPQADGVTVDYLDTATNERVQIQAETALFCLPHFVRPYLLPSEQPVSAFAYAPWVTANLSLSRPPRDLQGEGFIAWDNVLYEAASLGYVVATHQELSADPLRPTVWTWYRPLSEGDPAAQRETLLQARWPDWAETVLSELEVAHRDIRDVCERLDVTVLGHGMIRPGVGFVWGAELARARAPRGRLFFGHGDLSGMSLFEESQYRGVLAAEQALQALGLASDSFL